MLKTLDFHSGNSTSAVLDGVAILTMLPRGEDYTMTIPYAHCKGILMGTLSMELGGKVHINCEKTGYHTELEFKLKVTQRYTYKMKLINAKLIIYFFNSHFLPA